MQTTGDHGNETDSRISLEVCGRRHAAEGVRFGGRANVVCPGHVCAPLVDKQIPEQARKLHSSESDVLMPQESVDDVSTTVDDVAEVTLKLWSYPSSAPTGQPMVVSHGWFMQ